MLASVPADEPDGEGAPAGTGGVEPTTTGFVVRGLRNGSVVTMTWERGMLRGDPPTLDLVDSEIELMAVARIDPYQRAGTPSDPNPAEPLADPRSALELLRRVLDRVTELRVLPGGGG